MATQSESWLPLTEKMACTVASKPGGDRRLQFTVPAAQAQAKVMPCRSSTCSHAGILGAATAAQVRSCLAAGRALAGRALRCLDVHLEMTSWPNCLA